MRFGAWRAHSHAPSEADGTRPGPRGLVMHATWLGPHTQWTAHLAIWAEAQKPLSTRRASLADGEQGQPAPRTHSYCAKQEELWNAVDGLWRLSRPGVRPRVPAQMLRLPLWLPSLATRPWPSPELVAAGWATNPLSSEQEDIEAPLHTWRVNALLLPTEAAVTLLAGLPSATDEAPITLPMAPGLPAPSVVLASDLRFWSEGARFVLSLLVRQRFVPSAELLPLFDTFGYSYGPRLVSAWEPALSDPEDRARFNTLAAAMPDLCRAVAEPDVRAPERVPSPDQVLPRREVFEHFVRQGIGSCVGQWVRRAGLALTLPGATGSRAPNAYGYGYYGYPYNARPGSSLAQRWILSLAAPRGEFYVAPTEVRDFLEGMRRWHQQLPGMAEGGYRLCFRLRAPDEAITEDAPDEPLPAPPTAPEGPPLRMAEDGSEMAESAEQAADTMNGNATPAFAPPPLLVEAPTEEDARDGSRPDDVALAEELAGVGDVGAWRLDYLLQARDDPSLLVPLAEAWPAPEDSLRMLDHRVEQPREAVVGMLGQAAAYFPPLAATLRDSAPTGCDLTGAEAYAFLVEAAPALADADFGVLLPPWWKRAHAKPRLSVKLRGGAREGSGLLGLDAVISYDWKLALGGEELSRQDLEHLAHLKEPLVRLRGRWVQLRRDEVEAMLAFMRKHATGQLSLGEALRASLTGEIGDGQIPVEEVRTDAWIGDLLGRLRGGEALEEIAPPVGLRGTLRPYQTRGLGWLAFLARYGLGACLADDMGLGKTIELLSLLQHAKEAGQLTKPVLLVCPTSVVGNWRHESARFTPEIQVLIHHGAARLGRADIERFKAEASQSDLVVTTYSLLPRDAKALDAVEWGGVVLDEAQNIKNAETRQSRVARNLRAPLRVALTGTPVENRLAELWAIMDFLNPGYLGSRSRFQETLGGPIERLHDPRASAQLQALVRPFVLRRLKSDPAVISDLPEKLEIREYCSLTREQVTLYEAVVRDGLRRLEEAESPMRRRGVVLSMLVRLKQVCNHPAHLLDDGSALAGRSGKLTRLEELIEELLSEGDRALLFTQFTALAERLRPYLAERFGVEVLYLHGGVARLARERMVERFQSADGPPLFLLSLRAGGTGLNLTNANHVIHFDRWWNPAVENQATDRAFRIGQTRNVQVRKLICSGTLEERIDQLIEQKRELAEQIIGGGEGWLTELSTEQLRDLFTLRADALAD